MRRERERDEDDEDMVEMDSKNRWRLKGGKSGCSGEKVPS